MSAAIIAGEWADAAYGSKNNEAFLERGMLKSNIHQKRLPAPATARAHRQSQYQALCCSLSG